jgi:hypothetical protein
MTDPVVGAGCQTALCFRSQYHPKPRPARLSQNPGLPVRLQRFIPESPLRGWMGAEPQQQNYRAALLRHSRRPGPTFFRNRILDPDSDTDPDIRWSSGLFSKRTEVN